MNLHWKYWCWSWSSDTLATWCKEPTHLKRPWCWERLKAGEAGDAWGWDGWITSLTQLTWVWASSRRWWMTGKHGIVQSMGLQRVREDWTTEEEQQQPRIMNYKIILKDALEHITKFVTLRNKPNNKRSAICKEMTKFLQKHIFWKF